MKRVNVTIGLIVANRQHPLPQLKCLKRLLIHSQTLIIQYAHKRDRLSGPLAYPAYSFNTGRNLVDIEKDYTRL
jgi:hypothetical protein